MQNLILSIFPGIDLLGRAFEEEGYCVVRGPDILWGGDIKEFHPPVHVFQGVIGGPPCQIFSRLHWLNPLSGLKQGNLIPEFERVVKEATPEWWLMENVQGAPDPQVDGYIVYPFVLDNLWVGGNAHRRRLFWFGTFDGRKIYPEEVIFQNPNPVRAVVLAGHGPIGRGKGYHKQPSLAEICIAQGLPEDFADNLPFTSHRKREVLGNAVPLPMGQAIAKAIKQRSGR